MWGNFQSDVIGIHACSEIVIATLGRSQSQRHQRMPKVPLQGDTWGWTEARWGGFTRESRHFEKLAKKIYF